MVALAVAGVLPFAVALMTGSFLLFVVEPLVAKLLLPVFGGAPDVWNACLFAFQLLLLAGYAYAYLVREKLSLRARVALHVALLLVGFSGLPLAVPATTMSSDGAPLLRVFVAVLGTIGLPFFIVSTTAPVLQSWFAHVGHRTSKDPYFLYGASNVGSLVALVAYPTIVESAIGLGAQRQLWGYGYALLVIVVMACGWLAVRSKVDPQDAPNDATVDLGPVTARRRLSWTCWAFVPSSMLMGVTTYCTTDVAPLPIFWAVPLALYLASFVVAFATKPLLPLRLVSRILPLAATVVTYSLVAEVTRPPWLIIPLHLVTFFLAAVMCHSLLAASRPRVERLGEFYLWLSIGGALGGLFNAIVAPTVFNRIVEYPLIIVAACLCRQAATPPAPRWVRADLVVPALVGALAVGLTLVITELGLERAGLVFPFVVAAPLVVNYHFLPHPVRFALGLATIAAAGTLVESPAGRTIYSDRNFFGLVRVTRDRSARYIQIAHGNTVHGRQAVDPARRKEATGYYDRTGPVGQIVAQYRAAATAKHVGIVGLGSGGLAAYARPEETWTFYEINPTMVRIATNPSFFTFLADAFPDPSSYKILGGDARLQLATAPAESFGLLMMDAFTSDAIPTHLVTREALALYVSKLAPHGVVAFHISNRHLDLRPALAALATDARLAAMVRNDAVLSKQELDTGKFPSTWVLMARESGDLTTLVGAHQWEELKPWRGQRVWTDDSSSLLDAVRW